MSSKDPWSGELLKRNCVIPAFPGCVIFSGKQTLPMAVQRPAAERAAREVGVTQAGALPRRIDNALVSRPSRETGHPHRERAS